jgi:hypothetical protein
MCASPKKEVSSESEGAAGVIKMAVLGISFQFICENNSQARVLSSIEKAPKLAKISKSLQKKKVNTAPFQIGAHNYRDR